MVASFAPGVWTLIPTTDSVTEEIACPLCGSGVSRLVAAEEFCTRQFVARLGVVECRECGLVRVSPRLKAEYQRYVYAEDGRNTISHNYCWTESSSRIRFRPLLRRLVESGSRGSLLDVGCGVGDLLSEAARLKHWTLFGTDTSSSAVAIARGRTEAQVFEDPVECLPLGAGSINTITMLGLLEHVPDPMRTLRAAHSLLSPGGFLGVYVPNFMYLRIKDTGPLCRIRTGRSTNLYPQEHLFGYTRDSMKRLLRACGFQIIRSDVGQPFLNGGRVTNALKTLTHAAAVGIHAATGIHLLGLEYIARKPAS